MQEPAKYDSDVTAAIEWNGRKWPVPRRYVRRAIHNRDGFHMNVRPRQKESDGHQVIGAGIGVDNHGAAERGGPWRRLSCKLRRRK